MNNLNNSKKEIKNISLFSNAGIGEYGTSNIEINYLSDTYKIKTVIANELLEERALIYKENYPYTNMIIGSITDKEIFNKIIHSFNIEKPIIGTFSPPCQGSSGLNISKNKKHDFRNQLVKSIFQLFRDVKKNTLEYGYIENVVSYYKEEIPAYISKHDLLFHDYIESLDGEIKQYKYILLTNNADTININSIIEEKAEILPINIKDVEYNYFFGFNNLTDVEIENFINNKNFELVESIKTFDYIEKSLKVFGYKGILKNIRGDEYGASQIRTRGFFVFFKDTRNFSFPKKLNESIKNKNILNYKGKTVLDSLLIKNLIKVFDDKISAIIFVNSNNELAYSDVVEKNGKFYVDTSINYELAKKRYKEWLENGVGLNLHSSSPISGRYKVWLENTKEGSSAYYNEKRIHRPYKIISVKKKNGKILIKRNNDFILTDDNPSYFKKENIIDYLNVVTKNMKDKDLKEWGVGKRNWMIRYIQDRKDIEKECVKKAEFLLNKEDCSEHTEFKIFIPIKGFEAATYKRGHLDMPSSALTTKMNFGNSNTAHPIFDRVLTPAESLALFGIGYILNDNNKYELSKEYKLPYIKKSYKGFENLIFEISGEAILSIVAENILKDLTKQYLK